MQDHPGISNNEAKSRPLGREKIFKIECYVSLTSGSLMLVSSNIRQPNVSLL